MARKKVSGVPIPTFTKGKLLRLLFFVVLTAAGFVLNSYVPSFQSFGWGYTFGMIGMAILIG